MNPSHLAELCLYSRILSVVPLNLDLQTRLDSLCHTKPSSHGIKPDLQDMASSLSGCGGARVLGGPGPLGSVAEVDRATVAEN